MPEQVQNSQEKLWESLNKQGSYTKSYDEFKNQFSNDESIGKLYTALNQQGLYTKTKDDFKNQFFSINKESKLNRKIKILLLNFN